MATPPSPFVVMDADSGLKTLQSLVNGSVQYIYTGRPDIEVYVNERCLLLGLMPNREANRLLRPVIGYGNLLCGPVVIRGAEGEVSTDVPDMMIDAVIRGVWPTDDV